MGRQRYNHRNVIAYGTPHIIHLLYSKWCILELDNITANAIMAALLF